MILPGQQYHYAKYGPVTDGSTSPDGVKHARYSPSSMSRNIKCWIAPYVNHGKKGKRSKYADQGDNAHALGEYFLIQVLRGTAIDQVTIIGRPKKAGDPDDKMIEHCRAWAAYCKTALNSHIHQKHLAFTEKRVLLSADPELFGTADFMFLYQTADDGYWHLVIMDFKYGEGIKVIAEENWQLYSYGLNAIAEFENNTTMLQKAHDETQHPRALAQIVDVEMHIFQPRAQHPVAPVKLTRDELIGEPWQKIQEMVTFSEGLFAREVALENRGRNRLELITPEEYQRHQVPGKHCHFCLFKDECRAHADSRGMGQVQKLLQQVRPAIAAIRETLPQQFTEKGNPRKPPTLEKLMKDPEIVLSTGVLSDEDKAFISLNAADIKNLITAVHSGFKEELKTGKTNPWAFLGKASPVRGWIEDKQRIIEVLQEQFGVNFISMIPKELSITDFEERFGEGKLEALGLIRTVRETVKLVPANSAAEPAPPRGFNTNLIVRQLLGLGDVGETEETEEEESEI